MNKKLRGMIDEIFSDMKMTADNLALRDELMANATARYEDSLAEGKSEEEAFAEVASSLEDVRATLDEMNKKAEAATEEKKNPGETEFTEAVTKAFDTFSRQIFPQVGKLAQQADEATGKVFSGFGKAVGKGAVEVGRVAGETFEKISRNIQEATTKREPTAEELLARAKEIRIQAEIRQAADDQEGARQLRRKAYEMEMQAEAQKAREAASGTPETEPDSAPVEAGEPTAEETGAPVFDAGSGETADDVDQSALDAEIAQILEDVNANTKPEEETEGIHLEDAPEDVVVINRFDAELVNRIDVNLEADDIEIVPADYWVIETEWDGGKDKATQPSFTLEDGVLKIGRKNPDLFKTFFSLFQKDGGKLIVRVPVHRVVEYRLNTTSGDISVCDVPVYDVRVGNTSGSIRISPAYGSVAKSIQLNSVSGKIEVNAETEDVALTNVSGNIRFIGNADKVNCNTVSGKVQIEGNARTYTLETISGNSVLQCQNPDTEKIKASSVSGSVKIILPPDIRGFKVNMAGISRQISNEFGKNAYGTCELPIRFESMSGRLIISGWDM
ncbi:MAG: DUF4097 family beta strand repeat protein [Clostridia bacterium]|nr:DUF4097 family beta strand repeat protein [Clostridia bacterium]